MPIITVDEKYHDNGKLSDEGKSQLLNIQACDPQLAQLNQKAAIYQTARNAYAQALAAQLPESAHPNKKKDVINIDGTKYALADFSEQANAQLGSLRVVDQMLAETDSEAAMIKTAHSVYVSALVNAVS